MSLRTLLFFVVTFVTFASTAAVACPVCGANKSENDWAFGVTTLLLSFMPPLMFVGVVVWLVRKHKNAAREEANEASAISTPD